MTNKKKKSTLPGGVGAYMNQIARIILISVVTLVMASAAFGSDVTGNPEADGWVFGGNSLENGVYVQSNGSANYAYDIYTTNFQVTDSSVFDISDHGPGNLDYDDYYRVVPSGNPLWDQSTARGWEVGDTVVAVGGVFKVITAEEAGWGVGSSFTGGGVNANLVPFADPLRYQAKFGTAAHTWNASTIAPNQGNGSGSTSAGGTGTLLVRTTAFLNLSGLKGTPLGELYGGEIMGLQQSNHVSPSGISVGPDVARLIWVWDADNDHASSWQILINTTLVAVDAVGAGLQTGVGDPIVTTIQRASGSNFGFTDGLVNVASPPPALTCVGFKPPLDQNVVVRRPNRVLPLRMTLEDADGFEVFDITPPVVSIEYEGDFGYGEGELDELNFAGKGDEGNQFVFNGQFWAFNLSTKGLAPGTYTITAVSGNLGQYVIDPTCTVVVEIE